MQYISFIFHSFFKKKWVPKEKKISSLFNTVTNKRIDLNRSMKDKFKEKQNAGRYNCNIKEKEKGKDESHYMFQDKSDLSFGNGNIDRMM